MKICNKFGGILVITAGLGVSACNSGTTTSGKTTVNSSKTLTSTDDNDSIFYFNGIRRINTANNFFTDYTLYANTNKRSCRWISSDTDTMINLDCQRKDLPDNLEQIEAAINYQKNTLKHWNFPDEIPTNIKAETPSRYYALGVGNFAFTYTGTNNQPGDNQNYICRNVGIASHNVNGVEYYQAIILSNFGEHRPIVDLANNRDGTLYCNELNNVDHTAYFNVHAVAYDRFEFTKVAEHNEAESAILLNNVFLNGEIERLFDSLTTAQKFAVLSNGIYEGKAESVNIYGANLGDNIESGTARVSYSGQTTPNVEKNYYHMEASLANCSEISQSMTTPSLSETWSQSYSISSGQSFEIAGKIGIPLPLISDMTAKYAMNWSKGQSWSDSKTFTLSPNTIMVPPRSKMVYKLEATGVVNSNYNFVASGDLPKTLPIRGYLYSQNKETQQLSGASINLYKLFYTLKQSNLLPKYFGIIESQEQATLNATGVLHIGSAMQGSTTSGVKQEPLNETVDCSMGGRVAGKFIVQADRSLEMLQQVDDDRFNVIFTKNENYPQHDQIVKFEANDAVVDAQGKSVDAVAKDLSPLIMSMINTKRTEICDYYSPRATLSCPISIANGSWANNFINPINLTLQFIVPQADWQTRKLSAKDLQAVAIVGNITKNHQKIIAGTSQGLPGLYLEQEDDFTNHSK